jgi:hypothetical protein
VARVITADTFNRWWVALNERAQQEPDISKTELSPAGRRLNAKAALVSLEICTRTQHHVLHDGFHPDGQPFRRVVALGDAVVLEPSGERGDEFIKDLIRNIVALTDIEPEYVEEPVPGNDIEPMAERMREVREARDE